MKSSSVPLCTAFLMLLLRQLPFTTPVIGTSIVFVSTVLFVIVPLFLFVWLFESNAIRKTEKHLALILPSFSLVPLALPARVELKETPTVSDRG